MSSHVLVELESHVPASVVAEILAFREDLRHTYVWKILPRVEDGVMQGSLSRTLSAAKQGTEQARPLTVLPSCIDFYSQVEVLREALYENRAIGCLLENLFEQILSQDLAFPEDPERLDQLPREAFLSVFDKVASLRLRIGTGSPTDLNGLLAEGHTYMNRGWLIAMFCTQTFCFFHLGGKCLVLTLGEVDLAFALATAHLWRWCICGSWKRMEELGGTLCATLAEHGHNAHFILDAAQFLIACRADSCMDLLEAKREVLTSILLAEKASRFSLRTVGWNCESHVLEVEKRLRATRLLSAPLGPCPKGGIAAKLEALHLGAGLPMSPAFKWGEDGGYLHRDLDKSMGHRLRIRRSPEAVAELEERVRVWALND